MNAYSTRTQESTLGQGVEVRLINLTRDYGDLVAVREVSAAIAPGEFVTLLGASGSGKTTTLMMIAGFVTPSSGDVTIGGRSVLTTPPDKRNLGMVFQNYALFPHMSVAENIAFPLRMRKMNKVDTGKLVQAALEMVHLQGLGDRRINQISGGQQQRVALARALVFHPPVLLMDEPLGALDRKLRDQMQTEIKQLQRRFGLTVIYVTHDQEEALAMSDRIAIMHRGRILQVDTPSAVYERPATAYVAGFLGESNFLDGTLEEADGRKGIVRTLGTILTVRNTDFEVGSPVKLMVRPEAIRILSPEVQNSDAENRLAAVIEACDYLGQSIRYWVRVNGTRLLVRASSVSTAKQCAVGDNVAISFKSTDVLLFANDGSEV